MSFLRSFFTITCILIHSKASYGNSPKATPTQVILQQTQFQSELERYIRGLLSFREAVVLSSRFEDRVNPDFLLEARARLLPEHEFRGVIEVGVAELREFDEDGNQKVIRENKVMADGNSAPFENVELSCPVVWRWTRWGDDFVGEELFVPDYEYAIRESAEHQRPYFAHGIQFVLDQEGNPVRRGVRVFIPVFNTWKPERQSAFGKVDFEREYVGTIFATINLDPMIRTFFNDPKRPLELEVFHGEEVSESNRVSGFKHQLNGKLRPEPLPPADPPAEWLNSAEWYGIRWLIHFQATENYVYASHEYAIAKGFDSRQAWGITALGGLVTLLAFLGPWKAWWARKNPNIQQHSHSTDVVVSRGLRLTRSVFLWTGLVFGVGLLLTFVIYQHELKNALAHDHERLEAQANEMWHAVETRIEQRENSITLLHQFANRVGLKPFVEWRHLWQEFQDRMAVGGSATGLIEYGFGKIITSESQNLTDLGNEYGIDLFHLRSELERNGVVAVPLLSVTSSEGIPTSLGQDLLTADGQQKLALELSEQGLRPRISAKFDLYNSTGIGGGSLPVFRMFITLNHPVLNDSDSSLDGGNPTQRAWGFVYGTISMDLMLATIFGEEEPREVEMEIFAGAQPDPQRSLTAGRELRDRSFLKGRKPGAAENHSGLDMFTKESQYLQNWWIRYYTTSEFQKASMTNDTRWILIVGFVLSFCLSGIVFIQASARARAEELVHEVEQARSNLSMLSSAREADCNMIHDQVIQSVFAASIGVRRINSLVTDRGSTEAANKFRVINSSILDSLQQAARELRFLSWKISTSDHSEIGLEKMINMVQRHENLLGIRVDLQFTSAEDEIPQEVFTAIYPIVHEGISNAYRHGKASHVMIQIGTQNGELILLIKDDGKGFDPSRKVGVGLGLGNLNKRANELGGSLEITSKPNEGTELRFKLFSKIVE